MVTWSVLSTMLLCCLARESFLRCNSRLIVARCEAHWAWPRSRPSLEARLKMAVFLYLTEGSELNLASLLNLFLRLWILHIKQYIPPVPSRSSSLNTNHQRSVPWQYANSALYSHSCLNLSLPLTLCESCPLQESLHIYLLCKVPAASSSAKYSCRSFLADRSERGLQAGEVMLLLLRWSDGLIDSWILPCWSAAVTSEI